MTINLSKDEPLNLSKNAPLSTKVQIGAGWDFKSGSKIDLDLFAYTNTKAICYFNNKSILNGAVVCGPDNRDGKGQGIDETIDIDFSKVPSDVTKITICLSSFSGQTFDEVTNEFVQITDMTTNVVIAKTPEVVGNGKTLKFIELEKVGTDWVVNTLLQHDQKDFSAFVQSL